MVTATTHMPCIKERHPHWVKDSVFLGLMLIIWGPRHLTRIVNSMRCCPSVIATFWFLVLGWVSLRFYLPLGNFLAYWASGAIQELGAMKARTPLSEIVMPDGIESFDNYSAGCRQTRSGRTCSIKVSCNFNISSSLKEEKHGIRIVGNTGITMQSKLPRLDKHQHRTNKSHGLKHKQLVKKHPHASNQ